MSLAPRPALAAFIALLAAWPVAVVAQDLGGTWRTGPETVTVTVAEWGASCGPRPVSRAAPGGRDITVHDDGNNLTLQGNRTNRTDRCWSDNRAVSIVSTAHPSPRRWVIACSTPQSEALGEHGTYSLEASSPTHLRFRDETEYTWTIEGSRCRASSVLTREYDRTGAPLVATPTPPPRPTPPPPTPPAPSRCAHPGAPASLVVTPAHRSVPASGRACFHARVVDASRCEVPGQAITWRESAHEGAPDATLEGACLVVPAGASSGSYELTATAGALHATATATVVTADAYRSLVAAHLEDPDAGADTLPVGATSGTEFGSSSVNLAQRTLTGRVPWPWVLFGGAGALALIAALVALRRRGRAMAPGDGGASASSSMDDLSPARPSRRNVVAPSAQNAPDAKATVPTLVLPVPTGRAPAPAAIPPVVIPAAVASVASPAVAPAARPTRRCSACGALYGSELAFCPIDGTPLSDSDGAPVPVSVQVPQRPTATETTAERVCPKCKRRFAPPTQFCVEDGTTLQPVGEK